jgi:hypothetical protein
MQGCASSRTQRRTCTWTRQQQERARLLGIPMCQCRLLVVRMQMRGLSSSSSRRLHPLPSAAAQVAMPLTLPLPPLLLVAAVLRQGWQPQHARTPALAAVQARAAPACRRWLGGCQSLLTLHWLQATAAHQVITTQRCVPKSSPAASRCSTRPRGGHWRHQAAHRQGRRRAGMQQQQQQQRPRHLAAHHERLAAVYALAAAALRRLVAAGMCRRAPLPPLLLCWPGARHGPRPAACRGWRAGSWCPCQAGPLWPSVQVRATTRCCYRGVLCAFVVPVTRHAASD